MSSILAGIQVRIVVQRFAYKYLNVFKKYVNVPYRKAVWSG